MRIVRWRWLMVSLLSLPATVGVRGDDGSAIDRRSRIRALAPVEIVASGFEGLSAAAVDASGAVLVTDREDGTLTRIDAAGRRQVLLDGLHGPTALAVERGGTTLILEQGGRRLLRFSDGTVTIAASALRQARAIAVGHDGRVWLSMRRSVGRDDDQDDDRGSQEVIARLDDSGALIPFASGFVGIQALAAGAGGIYVVVERLTAEKGRVRTTLARVPIRADGSAGPIEPLLRGLRHRPRYMTIDAVEDVFFGGRTNDEDDDGGRAATIVKRLADGRGNAFATGLRDPVALAFAPTGDLIAAETHRVLRFRAPSSPQLAAPAFTNRTPAALNGYAEPGARVTVASSGHAEPAVAHAFADAVTGAFTLPVPCELNATTTVHAVATGAGGAGLAGAPAEAEIVHDDVPPLLAVIEPLSGTHTRGPIPTTAQAEDERSGVFELMWHFDGTPIAEIQNPKPEEPFAAETTLVADAIAEGPHTVNVTAFDRAGNSTVGSTLVVVDRTAPETLIITGPPPKSAARTVTFTVSGSDAWSALDRLDYAWRLDEGAWSAFDARAVITLSDLVSGEHRFEVKARDWAGNEDATPASQTFTVTALAIRITEPAPGAIVTTTSVWVRGLVESSGTEVGVVAALPHELLADLPISSLAAVTEAGMFAVEVPVIPGTTALTITASDAAGSVVSQQIPISVLAPLSTASSGFEASPPAGTAPHTVSFSMPAGQAVRFVLDLDGDGSAEYEGATLANQTFVYSRPGIYVATLHATTDNGPESTYRTVIEVYDRAALDARLQATWRGLKEALRSGDVIAASTFIHSGRRARWQEYFGQFTPDLFAAVDTVFADLTLRDVAPDGAECEMLREMDGLMYSFPVSFTIDSDGRWRLWQF